MVKSPVEKLLLGNCATYCGRAEQKVIDAKALVDDAITRMASLVTTWNALTLTDARKSLQDAEEKIASAKRDLMTLQTRANDLMRV